MQYANRLVQRKMGKSLESKTLYVLEQGSIVSKHKDILVVASGGQEITKIPIKSLGAVVLFGPIQITTQAILALSESDIAISFHTVRGQFRTYCSPAYSKNVLLRMELYKISSNKEICLMFSKKMVTSKIKNGMSLLQKYHLSSRSKFNFKNKSQFEKILLKIDGCTSLESLLGFEGQGASLYFDSFKCCFKESYLFNGRKYFPSPDPVNASLSFGYSMLSREIQSLLIAHGFDPYVGIYHKLKYGRASLALDLMEEYRHIIVDRLVLRLFNKNIFDKDDFFESSNEGVFLKKENIKRFIEHYENFLNKKKHLYQGKIKSYREIIRLKVEEFKRIVGVEFNYEPYLYT